MRVLLTLLITLSISLLQAQKTVVQIKDVLGEDRGSVKESFTITNKEDGSFALFIIGRKSTRAYLYGKDYTEISRISTDKVLNKGMVLMGYTIKDQTYQLISKGDKTGELNRTSFDFDTKDVTTKKMSLNLKGQSFLEFFSVGSKMYLLTLDKDSSNLIHYTIDDQGTAERNEIIIENTFYSSKGYEMTLKKILKNVSTSKILPHDKTSIQQASELLKFYLMDEDHLVFTVDYSNTAVYIFDISLKTFEVKEQTFFRPRPKFQEYQWKANSFLKDDYLFQIVSSKKEMMVTVTNRIDSSLVKQFGVAKDDEMNFTNSPMILEKTEEDRVLEKTSQFLRKISDASNGIAVSSVNGNYQITLGGKKVVSSGGGRIPGSGMAGLPVASVGSLSLAINPVFIMGDIGSSSYYTSVECVFDTSFNHISDIDASSLMLKRSNFLNPDIKNVAETFFFIDEDYFLGMYYKEADMYLIRKF